MTCWAASAKWAAGPALDDQRGTPLALSLTEGLDSAAALLPAPYLAPQAVELERWLGNAIAASVADEWQSRQMTGSGTYPERAAAQRAAQQTLW